MPSTIDLFATLTVLYVEDSKVTRISTQESLETKFQKVFVASDGEEGFEMCKENKDEIDLIITDVNMPKLSGVEMINHLRKEEINIPVIFTSAHTDSALLLGVIKLGINDYMVKPFNITDLFLRVESIFARLHCQTVAMRQSTELTQYLEMLNKVAIVSKTDLKGNITFVNDIFCEISGYSRNELIGQAHNIVRHSDVPKEVYKDLWTTVLQGKIWKGKVKNRAKNGDTYHVKATILPIFNEKDEISGFIGIRFLITEDEDTKREFRKKVLDHIKNSKEVETKLLSEIEKLKDENKNIYHLQQALDSQKERTNKQLSQLSYQDEEIKALRESSDKLKTKYAERLGDLTNQMKKVFSENKVLKDKNKENIEDINLKEEKIKRLQDYIEKQEKIIRDLKDVIEFGDKNQLQKDTFLS